MTDHMRVTIRVPRLLVLLLAIAALLAGLVTSASVSAAAPAGANEPAPPADADADRDRRTKPSSDTAPHRADELLVRFDPTTPEGEREQVRTRHRLVKIEDLPLAGLERVRTTGKGTPPERARSVGSERTVRFAEPNYLWQPSHHETGEAPNDALYSRLWALNNTGQTGGTPGADIDWPEATHKAADTSGIIVGVIDTGVQTSHPDLADNMWVNAAEATGLAGTDDDDNGFVDDIHGWDFHHNDASVFDDPEDDDHGTHVSGTIAGVAGNGIGVTGVSQARIMSLKFLGPSGGSTDNAIKALDYAIKMGAHVTNNSWGGGGYSEALLLKIQDAADAGLLFVAAAGNDGRNIDSTASYPSSYDLPGIISVAATDHNDALASYSNYGASTVDLGAPGSSVLSTVPTWGKAVAASHGTGRSVFHGFGLEGVLDPADAKEIIGAALASTGLTSGSVLVVDDDNGSAFQGTYTTAIAAAGYTVHSTTTVATSNGRNCKDGPGPTTGAGYGAVVWFTGADYRCTLTSTDQSNLTSYLNAGGKLVLFGEDIGYNIGNNSFLNDVLETRYVKDADGTDGITGVAGTGHAGLGAALAVSGDANQEWADALAAEDQGTLVMIGDADHVSGTSMATPHVTAAVAHLRAKYPQLPIADIKARLMNTGDAKTSLDGKTVSGRRLNLDNALTDATISGTVTADGGSSPAMAGICVRAWAEPNAFPSFSDTTDGSGAYSISVPTGSYRVQFLDCNTPVSYATEWHDGGSGAPDWFGASSVSVAAGETEDVDAALGTAFTISGTVTAASEAGGGALANICVRAYTTGGTRVDDERTAADGTYTLTGFAPGDYWVRFDDCSGAGYATQFFDDAYDSTTKATITITGSSAANVDAAMVTARTISGEVTSASTSANLADVCVTAWTASGGNFIGRVRTGADGTYTIGGMGPASYKVRFNDCSGRGFATEWWDNKSSFSGANPVSLTTGDQTGINAALS